MTSRMWVDCQLCQGQGQRREGADNSLVQCGECEGTGRYSISRGMRRLSMPRSMPDQWTGPTQRPAEDHHVSAKDDLVHLAPDHPWRTGEIPRPR